VALAVIPRAEVEIRIAIPSGPLWTPRGDEIDDEGFGGFRGTWAIVRPWLRDARRIVHADAELVAVADSASTDAEEFDAVARALEHGEPDDVPEGLAGAAAVLEAIDAHTDDLGEPLDGLELGVAGTVFLLAALGCYPAASCRGHPGGWSPYPVIFLAADDHRASVLGDLAAAHGCGLEAEGSRPNLLCLYSQSVLEMTELAQDIYEHRADFPRKRPRRPPRPGIRPVQLSLDFTTLGRTE